LSLLKAREFEDIECAQDNNWEDALRNKFEELKTKRKGREKENGKPDCLVILYPDE